MKPFEKFLFICLHSLDMRDFHSAMAATPNLDRLKARSIYIPMGRGQGHNQHDSLNAELTGVWTGRHCDSSLDYCGYQGPTRFSLPRTGIETCRDAGLDIITCISLGTDATGTAAVDVGMRSHWLEHQAERLSQFQCPGSMNRREFLDRVRDARRFYGHVFLRETHRPWSQNEGLCALVGRPPANGWPDDAFAARRAALKRPEEFAALRRRGLEKADAAVGALLEAVESIDDLVTVVYSNHGEVFDHFRYRLPYEDTNDNMIVGVSHGPYPYEVLYANMQMWRIPGFAPRVMRGIGRSIDMAPTMLELAGIKPGFMDGVSMLGDFDCGRFEPRVRFAEGGRGGCISMVREDGMKFVSTGKVLGDTDSPRFGPDYHRMAVFDLGSDPWEYVNLANTEPGLEVVDWAVREHRALRLSRKEEWEFLSDPQLTGFCDGYPLRAPGWSAEPEPDGSVRLVSAQDGVVRCNDAAATIWSLCDGVRTGSEIAHHLKTLLDEPDIGIVGETAATLRRLEQSGVIRLAHAEAQRRARHRADVPQTP